MPLPFNFMMRKLFPVFILINLLNASHFVEKGYIPRGQGYPYMVNVIDTDRDSLTEIIFRTLENNSASIIWFYEQISPGSMEFVVSDSVSLGDTLSLVPFKINDTDVDGLYDFIFFFGVGSPPSNGILIWESPDSFSYPKNEVWRDTVGPALVLPISVYDMDQDGIPEIVKDRTTPYGYLGIYESTGNNQYELIFADDPDTTGNDAPSSTHAFGDFDLDGKIEFVMGGMSAGSLGATYWVYEAQGNNQYEKILQDYVMTKNIKDCFSVNDADQDGKIEFVVKGFIGSYEFDVYIFEATGDNQYQIVDTLIINTISTYYGGYSASGDVDADGIPEIVLEAQDYVFIIKADDAVNNNFYIWDTLPGNSSGSSIAIYDVDNNGINDIIISGNDNTRIYEWAQNIEEKSKVKSQKSKLKIPTITKDKLILPINPSTHSPIYLYIYNKSGSKIKEIFVRNKIISLRKLNLSSGICFLKLESENFKDTHKIISIK